MNETLFEQDITRALEVLKQGGTILYPTDTIWGIGCDATNAGAAEKIIQLKQRPQQKSFVVLAASEKDVLQYTASPDLAVFDYLQTVQKPTTVIYEHALGLAENVCNADGSVAIRICSDEFCRHLIKRFRKPVVSTSANLSGEPSPASFAQVSPAIKNGVDYVVQYRQDDAREHTASSLIRWKNGKAEILRP
ncbi:L-threonylcarbamoyladenylate synthase [Parafilimonas sp.]|uniref:L-threonylcarbamoyladenylate synthase n=1 Tax=Parafilimonas sp. TaxID=1969739 RepID=UPI0039E36DD9